MITKLTVALLGVLMLFPPCRRLSLGPGGQTTA